MPRRLLAARQSVGMNIQTDKCNVLKALPDATMASTIARYAAIRPESPAIIMSKNDVLTYGALWARIEAFGAALRANGIGPSARVAIILPDGFELAIAIVAVACNAVAVPVNPKITATEIDDLFTRLRIDAMVTSSKIDTAARVLAARHGIRLFEVTGSGSGAFKISGASTAKSAQRDSVEPERDLQPDDLALILQTSATTGRSKLVPISHRNLVVHADRRRYWYNLTPDDRSLCVAPLYYARAIKEDLCQVLLVGGSVACPDREADGDFIDWLVSLKPTWFAGGQPFPDHSWNGHGRKDKRQYAIACASFGRAARRFPRRCVRSSRRSSACLSWRITPAQSAE